MKRRDPDPSSDPRVPRRGITRRQLVVGGAALLGSHALARVSRAAPDRTPWDLCVVGSGFAGLPIALRAADRGLRTIVIEPGQQLASSFLYSNSGPIDYAIGATRQIIAGGASAHWSGNVSRLWPEDLESRTRYEQLVDWPIRYPELEPYYCEAEEFLSVRGASVVNGAEPPRRCAYPLAPEKLYPDPDVVVDGRKLSFFATPASSRGKGPVRLRDVEIPRFASHPNGELSLGRRVVRVVSTDGESVDHLVTVDKNGVRGRVHARAFVIAAGVVESARLLLQSRTKPFPNGIGNQNGIVGRYFNYHPHFGSSFVIPVDRRVPFGIKRTHGFDGALRRAGLLGSNFQMMYLGGERVYIGASPETEPRADNRLTLNPDRRDSFGLPTPDLRLAHSALDEATFARAKGLAREIAGAMAGAPQPLEFDWRIHHHPAGPCRMGFTAVDGVVDRNQRVFGVHNLFVSGASVFPTSGTANPTNTVVALALRLADHLIGTLGG